MSSTAALDGDASSSATRKHTNASATSTATQNTFNHLQVEYANDNDNGSRNITPYCTLDDALDSHTINNPTNNNTLSCGYAPQQQHSRILYGIYWLGSIDGIVFVAFLCNIMVLSLPVILVPLAVEAEYLEAAEGQGEAEQIMAEEDLESTWVAAQVTTISSLAFLGGAIGKFVNGFICQYIGPTRCSKLYLFGMALSTAWFSMSHDNLSLGLSFAGMEFFSSVQYAALSVMLSNFYSQPQDEGQLAAALTALGLASTIGDVLAKLLGMALATFLPWRRVAQLGSLVALVGTLVVAQAPACCNDDPVSSSSPPTCSPTPTATTPKTSNSNHGRHKHGEEDLSAPYYPFSASDRQTSNASESTQSSEYSVVRSLQTILTSGLFWKLAIPYSLVFTACACDRLLVPFYNEMAGLPQSVCGGFTLSITLGLVHGLVKGSEQYATLTSLPQKVAFLRHRHIGNVAAALGLALLSYYGPQYTSNTLILTTAVVLLSAAMASTVSFQYFQLPCLIAQKYPNDKAVCISFLDGMGFLLSIPIFTALGLIVPEHGWYAGWGFLAALFAISGTFLVRSIPPILDATELYELHHSPGDDPTDFDPYFYFDWAGKVYTESTTYVTTVASIASRDFQNGLCVVKLQDEGRDEL